MQALVSKTLAEASVKKEDILDELYKALEYGEQLINSEVNVVDEMADTREGRQKSVLLEKASCFVYAEYMHVEYCLFRNWWRKLMTGGGFYFWAKSTGV